MRIKFDELFASCVLIELYFTRFLSCHCFHSSRNARAQLSAASMGLARGSSASGRFGNSAHAQTSVVWAHICHRLAQKMFELDDFWFCIVTV